MRPLPDASTFALIRENYYKAKRNSHDPHDERFGWKNDASTTTLTTFIHDGDKKLRGPFVDFVIGRTTSFGGRGLFVTEFVTQGQIVWGCDMYGIFRNETEWNAYVRSFPRDMMEELYMWSYVLKWNDDDEEEEYVIGIDLDEGSLMNHGGPLMLHHDVPVVGMNDALFANVAVQCHNGMEAYYATRDIHPMEEILCDYSHFHVEDHSLDWYTRSKKSMRRKKNLP